ncbi:MAG: hypothetical protein QOF01_5248 [Thermomicrobiales bacterium]|jgi:hypothetical protein|nr:hypothetical protein [Thermomicrobiales bacterium]
MLGPSRPRRLEESIAVSLEGPVPVDNFYAYPEAKPDLSLERPAIGEGLPRGRRS